MEKRKEFLRVIVATWLVVLLGLNCEVTAKSVHGSGGSLVNSYGTTSDLKATHQEAHLNTSETHLQNYSGALHDMGIENVPAKTSIHTNSTELSVPITASNDNIETKLLNRTKALPPYKKSQPFILEQNTNGSTMHIGMYKDTPKEIFFKLSARGLSKLDPMSGAPNPFAEITGVVGNGRTETLSDTGTPDWSGIFVFLYQDNINQTLNITVMDDDYGGHHKKTVGDVVFTAKEILTTCRDYHFGLNGKNRGTLILTRPCGTVTSPKPLATTSPETTPSSYTLPGLDTALRSPSTKNKDPRKNSEEKGGGLAWWAILLIVLVCLFGTTVGCCCCNTFINNGEINICNDFVCECDDDDGGSSPTYVWHTHQHTDRGWFTNTTRTTANLYRIS